MDRQLYIDRIKQKLDEWNQELADLEQQAASESVARDELERCGPELEEMLLTLEARVATLREEREEGWPHIRQRLDAGWAKVSRNLEDLTEKYVAGY